MKIQRKDSDLKRFRFYQVTPRIGHDNGKDVCTRVKWEVIQNWKEIKKAESKKIASWMYIGRSTKECNQQFPFCFLHARIIFCVLLELCVWQQCFCCSGDVFLSPWLLFISDGINRHFSVVRTVIKILWVLCLVS